MALTLNQIIARVKSLALSHAQIKFFDYNDPWEFDTNGEIDYPACFLNILPGTIDRTQHLQNFNFKFYFLSLVRVSNDTDGDLNEVISDMSSISADMLAMLMNTDFQYDWVISASNSFTPVTQVLGDMSAGVVVDVSISVEFFADRCQVPATDVTFENNIDMPRTRILTYTATGSEGNSWSIPGLSGKAILAAWRAGIYKRVTDSVPDDDEKIQVGVSDLGNGGGIMGSGVSTLNNGDQPILNEKFDFLYYQ